MKFKIATILLSIGMLVSCSEFNEVVKSEDYQAKFEMANSLFDKGSQLDSKGRANGNTLLRSVTLYEQIYQRAPKTAEGELAYFRIGKAYYLAQDFYMAGYYLGMFPQRFPYSAKAEESLFLSAMCSVNNSPSENLDQTETELAINDLQQFIDRYPTSPFIDSCNNIIDGLRFKIETKDYDAVMLYDKMERFGAAVSSAQTFADDYPMSQFKEEIHFVLVKNSYLLAKNSVESKKKERIVDTIERYNTFVSLFPDSEYTKSLDGYHKSMKKELEYFEVKAN